MKSIGPRGLELEVEAWRAPRLLIINIHFTHFEKMSYIFIVNPLFLLLRLSTSALLGRLRLPTGSARLYPPVIACWHSILM